MKVLRSNTCSHSRCPSLIRLCYKKRKEGKREGGREEGRKERRKEGKKEGGREGRKEGGKERKNPDNHCPSTNLRIGNMDL